MESYTTHPQNFIVFDLEWNMPSRASRIAATDRARMPYEIIEIGAVKLDADGNFLEQFSTQIKPILYTELNHYVAQVINRGTQSLKYGVSFPDAMTSFSRFCGPSYVFCTWSDSDAKPLKENLAFHGLDNCLNVRVLNVQRAFTRICEPGGPQRSVEYALDLLQIPKTRPFHQAVSDAFYTGQVLKALLDIVAREEKQTASEVLSLFIERYSYNPDLKLSQQQPLPAAKKAAEMEAELEAAVLCCPACEASLSFATVADLDPDNLQDWLAAIDRAAQDEATRTASGAKAYVDPDMAQPQPLSPFAVLAKLTQVQTEVTTAETGGHNEHAPAGQTPGEAAAVTPAAEDWSDPRRALVWTACGQGGKRRRCWLLCPEHGLIAGQARWRRDRDGLFHGSFSLRVEKT